MKLAISNDGQAIELHTRAVRTELLNKLFAFGLTKKKNPMVSRVHRDSFGETCFIGYKVEGVVYELFQATPIERPILKVK